MKERSVGRSWREKQFFFFFFCHFTQFNRRTVNGPFFFLSSTGINQEVSGACWIWAVVLFTDDWLASQNHQIHLPTVTFITVIFKVTATCLVSQHWPPHICSHLLSPSLLPCLCIHLPHLALSLSIWSATILLFLLLTTFIRLSGSFQSTLLLFTPRQRYTYSPTLLGRLRGSRVREVQRRDRRKWKGEKTKWDPHVLHCLKGRIWILLLFAV